MILTPECNQSVPGRATPKHRPRLGFLGVGWIGRNRLEAIAKTGCGEITAIADTSGELVIEAVKAVRKALPLTPPPFLATSLSELLDMGLDGIVIATPSSLHAEQSIAALERGVSVFCQKPLARTAAETRRVIEAARKNDCLLGVDLSYRFLNGTEKIRDLVVSGELGKIFAVELTFHNAYGPDKAWFYNPALSGGGCVIDLGIHLVDLALWTLGFPEVREVRSALFSQGESLKSDTSVEDYAAAQFNLCGGTSVQLSCSWRLPAGSDAVISAAFYGSKGGAILSNVNGSFYHFTAERCFGTKRELLSAPPEDWGGRAALQWARQLAAEKSYRSDIEPLIKVAETLDKIYGR
jgi:predicted dehydrogenase